MKRIRDLLTRVKDRVEIQNGQLYKQVTVRMNYKGVVLRRIQDGATIGTKDQFRVTPGQFLLSKIDARNGAFGIVPEELDGAVVTNSFLAFHINENEVEPEFFNVFLQSPVFLNACRKASKGTTNRKPVDETFFLNYDVYLPDLPEQHALIQRINQARAKISITQHEITRQELLLAKLKQAILQEAIQGKLTADWRATHPNVEPASQLLHRIQAEKARLIAAKQLRPARPLPKITPDKLPFAIPKTWEWCRLGDICGFITKGTTPAPHELKKTGDIPFLKVYNIREQKIDFNYQPQFIERRVHEGKLARSVVYPKDVLMNIVGPPLGKVAIVPEEYAECNINQALAVFRPVDIKISQFLYLYLCEGAPIRATVTKGVVGQDNISLTQCRALVFPVPPLAEQGAIVERVDALMATCRALELEIEHARTHTAQLLQAVLKEAFSEAS
ncbi:HsdS Restriction endonuclease S subunits [Candidatus Methylacidiphilaceae bacterium]